MKGFSLCTSRSDNTPTIQFSLFNDNDRSCREIIRRLFWRCNALSLQLIKNVISLLLPEIFFCLGTFNLGPDKRAKICDRKHFTSMKSKLMSFRIYSKQKKTISITKMSHIPISCKTRPKAASVNLCPLSTCEYQFGLTLKLLWLKSNTRKKR